MVLCLAAVVVVTGCASTKITNHEVLVTDLSPRPATIWVYNFAATADEVPDNSALVGGFDLDMTPQIAEEIAQRHEAGQRNGDRAGRADQRHGNAGPDGLPLRSKPRRSTTFSSRYYLLSVKEGSGTMRVVIDFMPENLR